MKLTLLSSLLVQVVVFVVENDARREAFVELVVQRVGLRAGGVQFEWIFVNHHILSSLLHRVAHDTLSLDFIIWLVCTLLLLALLGELGIVQLDLEIGFVGD